MERFNLGKIALIILGLLVVFLFFGRNILGMFNSIDDVRLNVSNMQYTKKGFDSIDKEDKDIFVEEIASACVFKHHIDDIPCSDTAYWLANSLENQGVDGDLAIALMPYCVKACETRPAPKVEVQQSSKPKNNSGAVTGGATKWFWEN